MKSNDNKHILQIMCTYNYIFQAKMDKYVREDLGDKVWARCDDTADN